MKTELEHVHPAEIERRSFSIISRELGPRTYAGPYDELIFKACDSRQRGLRLRRSPGLFPGAVESAMEAIRAGADIVTDTQMAKAGINKTALARFGGQVRCFMSDRTWPGRRGTGDDPGGCLYGAGAGAAATPGFAVGNAPTALVRLYELVQEGETDAGLDHRRSGGLCQRGGLQGAD